MKTFRQFLEQTFQQDPYAAAAARIDRRRKALADQDARLERQRLGIAQKDIARRLTQLRSGS